MSLREKCANAEFFLGRIFPHLDSIQTGKNSVFGHISQCACYQIDRDQRKISLMRLLESTKPRINSGSDIFWTHLTQTSYRFISQNFQEVNKKLKFQVPYQPIIHQSCFTKKKSVVALGGLDF